MKTKNHKSISLLTAVITGLLVLSVFTINYLKNNINNWVTVIKDASNYLQFDRTNLIKIISTKDNTTVVGGKGKKDEIEKRVEQTRKEISASDSDFETGAVNGEKMLNWYELPIIVQAHIEKRVRESD